jgi:hypothetical protein
VEQPSLMQAAKTAAPSFKRPNVKAFIPKGQEDAVARVVAAGMKVMYSPEMREEVMAAVQADQPVGMKLGQNVAGLMLTLDQQAPNGIPVEALFPAAGGLLIESADTLQAAGIKVTQEDFDEGMRVALTILAKKMGATDDQIMQEAQKRVGGQPMADGMPAEEAEAEEPPEAEDEAEDDADDMEPEQ